MSGEPPSGFYEMSPERQWREDDEAPSYEDDDDCPRCGGTGLVNRADDVEYKPCPDCAIPPITWDDVEWLLGIGRWGQ